MEIQKNHASSPGVQSSCGTILRPCHSSHLMSFHVICTCWQFSKNILWHLMRLPGGQPFQSKFGRLCIVCKRATKWRHLDWSLTLQNVINMYQVLPPPKKSKPLAFQPSFWFFTWLWKTDFVDLLHILRVILRRKRGQRSQRQNGKVRDGASITPVCLAAHGKSVGRPIAGSNMQTHQAVDQIWRVFQQITVTEMCLESITGIKYHAVIYQC